MQSVSGPPIVNSLDPVPEEPSSAQVLPPIKTAFNRPPSIRGTLRTAQTRRTSFPPSTSSEAPSPASEATSWRSKALPTRSTTQQPSEPTSESSAPVAVPPPNTTLPEVVHLTIEADEDLEVIDFSEHGKLAGVISEPSQPEPHVAEPPTVTISERRRPRPLAIDFFDDEQESGQAAKSDEGPWRRRTENEITTSETTGEVEIIVRERLAHPPASAPIHPTSTVRRRLSVSSDDHSRQHSGPNYPGNTPRSPQGPHYREAPMSALDDTMARIKGALVGMQKPEPPKPPTKWLPPALRPRSTSAHPEDSLDREIFDVSSTEPPRSPKPAWNHFSVKLPPISHLSTPLSRRQVHASQSLPHVRADIFSWDPPMDGMNRKDFHLNDILFKRPIPNKGPIKYAVVLPGNRSSNGAAPSKPVVHLPQRTGSSPAPASLNNVGAFGRRREADGAASWRKPPPSPLKAQASEAPEIPESLDTVSRSPPPEAPISGTVPPTSASDVQSPAVSVATSKARPTKMPIGTDVAFYRDSPTEPKSTVNFIVNSELEEQVSQVTNVVSQQIEETSRVHPVPPVPRTPARVALELNAGSPLAEQGVPTLISKNETRKIETQVNFREIFSMVADSSRVFPVFCRSDKPASCNRQHPMAAKVAQSAVIEGFACPPTRPRTFEGSMVTDF